MTDIAILELTRNNIPLLRRLNELFCAALRKGNRFGDAPPSEAHLLSLLAADGFIALIACVGSEIVGGLAAYELVKLEREVSEVYIFDLAVAERYRRRGIATALVKRLRLIAANRGAEKVFVQADRDNEPAMTLYSKVGNGKDVRLFDIDPKECFAR